MDFDAHGFQFRLEQCPRADEVDVSAHGLEAVDIGAGDAAVVDITDDDDLQAVDMAFDFLNGEHVEEALCRMFVGAITGVDDDRVDAAVGKPRRTFLFLAHDDGIDTHGRYRQQGIAETFAFLDGASPRCEVDDIGAEILGSHFKGTARTRARFPEHVDHRFPFEQG